MPSLLFKWWSGVIFKEVCFDGLQGMKLDGITIIDVEYADVTVLMAIDKEEPLTVINRVMRAFRTQIPHENLQV